MDGDLHVEFVGDAEASVDRGGRGAPIFVEFQADGAGEHLVAQRLRRGAVAFAEEAEVDRVGLGGFEHAVHIPPSGRARGSERAVRRAGAAADQRGDAGADGFVDLLWADEVDVRVDAAGGDDAAFTGDGFGAGADDHGIFFLCGWIRINRTEAALDARVAGVANADDAAVLDADVGLDNAEDGIEDERVGDDEVERLSVGGDGRLAHAVADDLAAAEFDFIAVTAALGDEIALDL